MTEMIIKCAALVLCGVGIGAAIVWRLMYTPKPMTQSEARRRADELYNRLLQEVNT